MGPSFFPRSALRPAEGESASRVTYVELFFDLVFVFAVTQVSHVLVDHRSGAALLHTLILALVIWWAWVFTTWAASWLNPERAPVRALLIVLMLIGMLMSAAIPDSFGSRALLFALSLVAMNLVRSIFTIFAFLRSQPAHAVNFVRITLWHAAPGVLWIVGALQPEQQRLWIWLVALAADYLGPRVRFWTPGLGGSPLNTWNVSGAHMSERVSLFIIIALGESIVDTGAGFSGGTLTGPSVSAFLAAFVGTVLMWLLYFNHAQRTASEYLIRARERGMVAQTAFTYIPALLVLGIILGAVANGLVLALGASAARAGSAGGTASWAIGLLCASSSVYLAGNMLFKRATGGPWLLSHLVGAVVLAALASTLALEPVVSPLAVSWFVNGVLVLVVIADELTFRRLRAAQDDTGLGSEIGG